MAIDSKSLGPVQAYQKLTELNSDKTNKSSSQEGHKTQGLDNALQRVEQNVSKAEMRIEQQASLVSHLFGDGEKTAQSSLKLTYQSAIEKINYLSRLVSEEIK